MKTLLRELHQRPISYYPIYRKITGSTTGGVLLSQLMYWFSIKNKFYKTDDEIMAETLLTKKELETAKIKIKKLDFIIITREGIPAKTYYEINWEQYEISLIEAIEQREADKQKKAIKQKQKKAQTNKNVTKESPKQKTTIETNKEDNLFPPFGETTGNGEVKLVSPKGGNCIPQMGETVLPELQQPVSPNGGDCTPQKGETITKTTLETSTKTTTLSPRSSQENNSKDDHSEQKIKRETDFNSFVSYIRTNYINQLIVRTKDKYTNQQIDISVSTKGYLYELKSSEDFQGMRAKELWNNLFDLHLQKKINLYKEEIAV